VELYLHSPKTPSWRGSQFKKSRGTNVSLPLHLKVQEIFHVDIIMPTKVANYGSWYKIPSPLVTKSKTYGGSLTELENVEWAMGNFMHSNRLYLNTKQLQWLQHLGRLQEGIKIFRRNTYLAEFSVSFLCYLMMLFQLNNLHSSEKEDSHKW
jgi:hypothetical protein